ncbi:MAG: AMP-binding protein, partial [Candidatus Rokubacteria bacterium]|nr:AMP-binding protein [Candidatus Rokubacteria bacterium]
LDQHRQPVPVGVPGEMYVGGAGVARGYLNRPELTAERFVTVPFDAHSGSRLYRSGDLARRLSDGDLEYLGRIDHQVKIRGFRIELGEIETTLGQHPDLREVLVVAREDVPGDKRLVAYVVARSKPAPSVSQLRALLGERLPAYMVPSAFVFMDALPMTPNGKVDRRALPAPDLQRPELETAFVAPRTETERVVAAVWRKVLGVEQVGIHDDFFHLGGHSLLVAQVMARLGDAFGVTLPLRHLFEAATVADLAEKVDMAVATVEHLRAAPLTAGDEREEIEL